MRIHWNNIWSTARCQMPCYVILLITSDWFYDRDKYKRIQIILLSHNFEVASSGLDIPCTTSQTRMLWKMFLFIFFQTTFFCSWLPRSSSTPLVMIASASWPTSPSCGKTTQIHSHPVMIWSQMLHKTHVQMVCSLQTMPWVPLPDWISPSWVPW